MFEVPVVLFMFKRLKAVEVIRRIREIKPSKLYLLADNGRNEEEKKECENCRTLVEKEIDWDCEIIKNYAEDNRGVYKNIGGGSVWVLKREKNAIFLEDDNLPEISFFYYCKEMLEKYSDNEKILWVCGTNYLGKCKFKSGADYSFTKHMLPCGWATWSHKFLKYYDGDLLGCKNTDNIIKAKANYYSKRVANQYSENWLSEYRKINDGEKPSSWDYQMDFSIKVNGLYGIIPAKNQIKNIGVDEFSIHGGNSFDNVMTKRFCGMPSYPLSFPLKHPNDISVDLRIEKKLNRIITVPYRYDFKKYLRKIIVKLFRISPEQSIKNLIRRK